MIVKKTVKIIAILLALILLIPIHVVYKDGGSGGWHAIAWQYTRWHQIAPDNADGNYIVGSTLTLFGVLTVYDSTHAAYLDD